VLSEWTEAIRRVLTSSEPVSGSLRRRYAVGIALFLCGCGATSAAATPAPSVATRTPTPVPTVAPQPTSANVAPAAVLLSVDDFPVGSVDETSPSAQTPPGCAPGSPAGFVAAAGSRVTDVKGFNWSNVVLSFDDAADAHAYATAFFEAARNCATGSGASPGALGDSSFTYTQRGYAGGFGPATVEVVQVGYLVTMVLDGPNLGNGPPASELPPLAEQSVSKLTSAAG
jgi:hypothetical protein